MYSFATTQICEACAVAVQTLMAREVADSTTPATTKAQLLRYLITISVAFGGLVATALSISTYLNRTKILAGLTTNIAVQEAAAVIFPVVLLTQVLKGLAYPVNGILMGGLDWFYSMLVMWLANFACVGLLNFSGLLPPLFPWDKYGGLWLLLWGLKLPWVWFDMKVKLVFGNHCGPTDSSFRDLSSR